MLHLFSFYPKEFHALDKGAGEINGRRLNRVRGVIWEKKCRKQVELICIPVPWADSLSVWAEYRLNDLKYEPLLKFC